MIEISEYLPPAYSILWDMVKQCGVTKVVGAMDLKAPRGGEAPWALYFAAARKECLRR